MAYRPLGRSWERSFRRRSVEELEERCLLSVSPVDPPVPDPQTVENFVHLPTQYRAFDYQGFLTPPSSDSPVVIAERYLQTHANELGMLPSDVDNYFVTTNYVTQSTGATTLTFEQSLHGLPVFNANFNITVMPNGQLVSVLGGFVPGLSARANQISATPGIDSKAAVTSASAALGWTLIQPPIVLGTLPDGALRLSAPGVSRDEIVPRLQYVSTAGNNVSLAWQMTLRTPDGDDWYNVSIDTTSGDLVALGNYVEHASYEVYAIPKTDPDDAPRTIEVDPHLITPAATVVPSPFGWHDTNGVAGAEFTITRGNNVNAYADRDANNIADPGSQPDGGANLNFTGALVPINLNQQPSTYTAAAVTNLFYWTNLNHDIHYLYGFDEAARNFQVNNYGRGGIGNDAVNAEAQDGEGFNNANFATLPDGTPPRMQMYEFNITDPRRDGDLDAEIIVHEFGHGVSSRLTGNANGLFAIQSGGMGEGWSDWWSLMFTQETADETTVGRGVGMYVLGQPQTGMGIRDFKYDFDIANQNLETFLHYNTVDGSEVHTSGTRWTATLWDINKLLIDKYGFEPNVYNVNSEAGNIKALKLVMNALKIQPLNPSFIDGRDAILLADQMLFDGANQQDLWTAFARRGLGKGASTSSSNSTTLNTSFEVPLVVKAVDDVATTLEDTGVVINVLANDQVQTGSVLVPSSVQIIAPPAHGTAVVNFVTGAITYNPGADYFGSDSFTYTVKNDLANESNQAIVNITITPVNDAPLAINDMVHIDTDTAVNVDVLVNDLPIDSAINVSSLEIVDQPIHGTAALAGSGQIAYTPDAGFVGGDRVTYRVKDVEGLISNIATVVIKVGPLGSLAGIVYVDTNNNGIREATELGLPGVPIYIDKTDGIYTYSDFVLTDSTGAFRFEELVKGTYNLREVHPAYFVDGKDTAGVPTPAGLPLDPVEVDEFREISLPAGGNGTGFHFGEYSLRPEFVGAFVNRSAFFATGEGVNLEAFKLAGEAWVAGGIFGGGGGFFGGGFGGGGGGFIDQVNASVSFDASSGPVTMTLYDESMHVVARSDSSSGFISLSASSVGGQTYFVKLSGRSSNVSLDLSVVEAIRRWRNAINFYDVTGDGPITALDALVVINALNRDGAGSLVARATASNDYLDVNGDDMLTPLDALLVINRLNVLTGAQSSAGAVASSLVTSDSLSSQNIAFALAVDQVMSDQEETNTVRRRR